MIDITRNAPGLRPAEVARPSEGQKALWFLERLAPEGGAYHIVVSGRVRGAVEAEPLRRALLALVARHLLLRARFPAEDGEPALVISPAAELDFAVLEMASEDEARRRLAAEAYRPFDLERGPLFRARLATVPRSAFLLVVVHHIVADFWSLAIIARELGQLYTQETGGSPADLPLLDGDPRDFAQAEAVAAAGAAGERAWDYWRAVLAPPLPVLDLATDHPRPPVQTWRGAARRIELEPPLVYALRAFGRRRGATLFAALATGFEALLHRASGQPDLLLGTLSAGRGAARWAGTVGYFVNPLVLRSEVSGATSFAELLARTRAAAQGALEHQALPFPLLAERLQPVRDPSRPPLFQALFTLQKGGRREDRALAEFWLGRPGAAISVGGFELEWFELAERRAQFELALSAAEGVDDRDALTLALEVNADLFDGSTAARFLAQLATLFAAAVAAPDRPLAELPLLGPAERHQVLVEWNDGAAPIPAPAVTLDRFFAAQAAATPDAVALVAGTERWTYRALEARCARLAQRLRAAGVGPEVRVAVLLRRSPALVAALLAVHRAGGAYVPLDPAYPESRLLFMLEDSGATVLLTETALAGSPAAAAAARRVLVDDSEADPEDGPEAGCDSGVGPRNLAYVIYTSGSTGRPKGVGIEHGSAAALLGWARQAFSPAELSGMLAATSISFDLSVFELFAPLTAGGRAILAQDALELPSLSAASEVRLLNTVPSVLSELLRVWEPAAGMTICLAGEPLPRSLAEQLSALGVGRVLNLYGPSEDTTYSTSARIEAGGDRPPAIGRPLPGRRAHLLGPGGEPAPAGIPGEIHLGGAGLARGYLGSPDLTAERFVPDPFALEPGARLYRTGDLARRLPDSAIEFLGRIDQQVKVRGFRVELGEVEAVLESHPAVRQAVVAAREGPGGGARLVAWVLPAGKAADADELRRFLAARLPDAMIPTLFVPLDIVPLTPGGKVDRKALPAPTEERPDGEAEWVAPRAPTEALLAGIWREVLGLSQVGVHDSFFTLGGHSLLATRVAARIRRALGAEIPVRALFEAPTLEGLAALLDEMRPAEGSGEPPLIPLPRTGPLPLSFAQQRLWLLDRLAPGSPAYNLPGGLAIAGPLAVPALARAFAEIVRRHETLRTTYAAPDGEPVQAVQPAAAVPLPLVDLGGLAADGAREAEGGRLLAEEAARPFDLEHGPVLRLLLLRLAAEEHRLAATLHHIAADGWSLGLLGRELAALFAAGPALLPPLPVQFGDFAVWQRRCLAGPALDADLDHWRRQLAGVSTVLSLPLDRPRPAVRSGRGAVREDLYRAPLAADLAALGERAGTTLFMVLLAGFEALLGRWTGEEDFALGTPEAGRDRVETEGLIGCFVNTLVVRTSLAGDPPFEELLNRVREVLLTAQAHRRLPFERLVEELDPQRDPAYPPLIQATFSQAGDPRAAFALPGLRVTPLALGSGAAKFDLSLEVTKTTEGLRARLDYSTDLFDATTAARLLAGYSRLLAAAAAEPGLRLSALDLSGQTERQQALVEWNDTGRGERSEPFLHRRIAAQAAATPAAMAVAGAGERTTYGELAERSRQLAGWLLRHGVRPERPVGICLERSVRSVTATLAVLEAGGVVLPLDPAHPPERIAATLEDAGAGLLLTVERLARMLPPTRAQVVLLDRPDLTAADPGPPRRLEPESAAYLIYTSGSTGTPKASVLTHAALWNLVSWLGGLLQAGPGDRASHLAGPAFDATLLELWPALTSGAAVHIPAAAVIWDPALLLRWLADERITLSFLPTPLLEAVLGEPPPPGLALRVVTTGGDRLSRRPPAGLSWRLLNLYGPTENTSVTTWGPVASRGAAAPSIGRPIAGVRVHLLDRALRPVPLGAPGEICAAGANLSRGYLERPALTAERFLPDPFAEEPGARLYRTGDLGRRRPEGNIEFLGRVDQQIKVRGVRIEPGEIEAALALHPAVREAAVVAPQDGTARRLVAFLVPAAAGGEAPPRGDEIAGFLRRRLPAALVPEAFAWLPALPLSPNGKVDRRALLRRAAAERAESRTEEAQPRGPLEELVAGAFAEVLRRDAVGREASFFDLGGHSLLAARLIARLRASTGREIPLAALFEAPTAAALAARLEAEEGAGKPPLPPLQRVDRGAPLPLSFVQRRLWFLDRLEPGGAAYTIASALRLDGALDVPALERALGEIVRRHEVLRTTFEEVDGEPRQRIHRAGAFHLPLADLSGCAGPAGEREALRLARDEARRPFDLARGPLLRLLLVRLGACGHLLALSCHHTVADGGSLGLFARELTALYGSPRALPEPPFQYADFAAWQRQAATTAVMAADLAFWTRQLAGAPPLLALPLDRPRPPVETRRGALRPAAVDPAAWTAARRLAREAGATPFLVLLAAFHALLGRWAGQDDVSAGTPVAGRRLPELEGMMGCFVNTLVLRSDLTGDPSFSELLVRARAALLAAHAHQDLPFERLVETLAPERRLGHAPLVQAMLAFADAPEAELAMPGIAASAIPLDRGACQLDLTLALAAGPHGVGSTLEYNRDLFDAATAERLLAHFRQLFAAAAADPGLRLSELPMLRPAERHQLLREWNDTRQGLEEEACLHGLVAAQAARTPAAVAVEGEELSLTYGELLFRADRLAGVLRRLGVGPEARVGICLERSPDLVVALLATLRAGGAYVPLDPGYPRERLGLMLEDAQVAVLVTESRLRGLLPETDCPTVALDAGWEALSTDGAEGAPPPHLPAREIDLEGLAYVIFTSGSTGRPKGAMNTHAGIVRRLLWMQEAYGLGTDDAVLQKTPFSFDVSVWELFWPLLAGARLVLARPGGQGDPVYLARRIAERGVTTVHFVPSMLRAFLDGADTASCGSLRRVIASGEALSPDLRDRALALLPGAELENLYGPTEASVDVTRWSCRREIPGPTVPIGRPLANTSIHLLDAELRPVPVGVAGELFIGGRLVGRGYLGRPDLTAERFVPDSIGGIGGAPGGRLYRTGDLARRLPGGAIDYLGRADDQVKVRGVRIELGEVETALLGCPGVREAAVAAREITPGDVRLVAWIAPEGLVPADVAAQLRGRLPAAMVPSIFAPVPCLPLTPSGKVDRRALATPADGADRGDAEPPRGEVEELLAAVWAELLGTGRVGRDDGFFALGGHSLLATRLVSRVRQLFAVELPLQDVFAAPTLAGLAARITAAREAGTVADGEPLAAFSSDGRRRPLSFAQERLWFLEQLEPGSLAYVVPLALRLAGDLDAPALAGALAALTARHETLRTRFASAGAEVWQEVGSTDMFAGLPLADLGALPAAAREAELLRLARAESECGFDLARGPLFRAALLRLAADRHALLLTLHHAVSDAWSLGVLLRDLGALYGAVRRGTPALLPPLPVQYADFATWQRRQLSGAALEAHLAYFRERLRDLPPELDLPFDRPRPDVRRPRGAQRAWAVPAPLAAELRALGRREGATLFMVLLAAFAALLSRHAGQDAVTVGAPVAHRTRREVEDLIGFFANTLALRLDLGGDPPFGALLARAREAALGAYAHQDLPFERLVEELAPERSRSRPPLAQAVLALHNVPLPLDRALLGLAATPLPAAAGAAKFDLTLGLVETSAGLSGSLEYDPDLFDAPTAERLLARLSALLEGVAGGTDRPLSELPLLPQGERHQILHAWNDTGSRFPRKSSLEAEFAAQAARSPDATALLWDGGRLTYRELDAAAGRLAERLRKTGVRPEARVGLFAARSPEAVVGTLAILKAGAAYVPLDPDYPEERLALLLADAAVGHVLAQEEIRSRLPASRTAVIPLLLETVEAPEPSSPPILPAAAGGDRLAYVMYTSGSTGRPKGVAVTHANVLRLVRGAEYARMGPGETFLQLAPVSFDAATLEIWGPLLAGGVLAIPAPGPLSLAALGEALARFGVTTLWLTAGLFHRMVEENLEGLAPVRQLLAGGDVLSPGAAARVLAALPGCRLINGYGPTEGTTFSCCHPVTPAEAAGAALPIGRPIANTRAHVLSSFFAAAPLGVTGELAVGGAGLARGYLDDSARTAERFVPDPFSGVPGERLYRTGDRVRQLPDGRLFFVGRLDRQVKIRGFRVEPAEVEAALARHPDLAGCAVDVRPDPADGKRLVAWAVPVPGAEISAAGLRDFLAGLLPAPLIPSVFGIVPALPLDPNGKVDRRALPAPDAAAGPRTLAESGLSDPLAEVLAGLFADALGRARVEPGESFFDLGGHSLLAMRLVARVREALGIELPLADLFAAPTPAALAQRVAAAKQGETDPPLVSQPRTGDLPLSFAQERLWFLDQLAPGGATYNIAQAVDVDGPLDPAALGAALGGVVARHEALRTVVAETPAGLAQKAGPPAPVPLPVTDLSGLPAAAGAAESQLLEKREAARPFDLAAGPLLRAGLIRHAADRHRLLLVLHHIVADGWSMGILVRETVALYIAAAVAAGRPSPLPPLPLQYADFALWQRRRLEGKGERADLAYWRDRLAGVPPALDLPTDRPRPPVLTARGEAVALALPEGLSESVAALARSTAATPFMVLLTAFAALLARWAGQEDFTVGSPVAGRRHREIEGVIGPFLNLLVLRAGIAGDPAFREALERTKATTLEAYAHQDLPFERLVEELRPERDLGRSPLFQVMLALQNTPAAPLAIPGLALRAREVPTGTAKFDWTLGVHEEGGRTVAALEVAADLFDRATAARVLHGFVTLLAAAVADPGRRLAELPLLPAEESAQLLAEWNDTAAPLPDLCIQELFEYQADRVPDAVVLEHGGERWTYGELEVRANRLAHALRAAGVGPEVRVALLYERSAAMVAALLAVLKAGGAYVPLDPGHPAARLQMILEDCGAALLLAGGGLPPDVVESVAALPAAPRILTDDGSAGGDASRPAPLATPGNLAYVLYTSGSTGRPKGVGVPHRAMVNFLSSMARRPGLAASDRLLAVTTLSFDIAGLELLLPLAVGATLVLARREEAADGVLLAAALECSAATALQATPSTWRLLLEAGWPGSPRLTALCGGEALPPDVAERLATGTARLFNLYGPTETTVWSTLAEIRPGGGAPAIGRPIANTRIDLVDPWLAPVPPGAAGELWIGGAGVARGYLGRPDLTAERFVPDPFSDEPGARAYRTGDLARRRADGAFEFLGRLDYQVKVRGFRIELQEVEAALAGLPGVRAAAAAVREEAPGDRRLVAYLVLEEEGELETAVLRRRLGEVLPAFMIPSAFVRLAALPLTPNGKVDRRALPAPGRGERSETEFVPPRTPLEEALALLAGDILGIERVGATDDFFDLGGHSLLAARFAASLRESFAVDLPLRTLFRGPTVEAMARELTADPAQRSGVEKRARLLLRLARMSEEEATALLGEKSAATPHGGAR